MSPALLVFGLLGLAALVSSLGAVTARSVVYSALFLLGALVAVAGFFILLLAEFLGLSQLLLYGGTVVVLIFFVLMLTRQEEREPVDNPWRWGAAVTALLFLPSTRLRFSRLPGLQANPSACPLRRWVVRSLPTGSCHLR